MTLDFYKYQGAGNDFVMLHDAAGSLQLSHDQVVFLCDRRFGIGGDGLIILQPSADCDFKMQYYNSDGSENTFCGNGGRCVALFAQDMGVANESMSFMASDGLHHAAVLKAPDGTATVSLGMQDVPAIEWEGQDAILNTGSPHFIRWVDDLEQLNVAQEGSVIRHQSRYEPNGINVNFVRRNPAILQLRTYERGVEAETLACGTGITAAAIASTEQQIGIFDIAVQAAGGSLSVSFEKKTPNTASNILLTGPAKQVFAGQISF